MSFFLPKFSSLIFNVRKKLEIKILQKCDTNSFHDMAISTYFSQVKNYINEY